MLKAVIFDIDGTLIDSVDLHAEAWKEALRHFGHDLPFDRVRAQIGKGGDLLLLALLPKEEAERRGEEIEKYRLELFRREYLPRVKAFPKVPELFERIRADGKRHRTRLIGQGGGAGELQADRRDRRPPRCGDLVGRRG